MALVSGTRLGPYEIQSPIGAGGMGEVYRAVDSRLGRAVAVKILPAQFSSSPDRLRRFEREARAAGVLNHPNILDIHDVGTHDGVPYVVSELLEGETLREHLGTVLLPPRKVIDYALQVAHGLSAAHHKGIVHRDLKPENLFITRDGRVKILDFGLAKLTQPATESEKQTNLPTVSQDTEPGKVMGTVGYMSPEQILGKPADHRSDIFTFGTILYEMLSGKRAFYGESSVETMNAILKQDVPQLSKLEPDLPPAVQQIVNHCLEKKPEERFQSAQDLAFALQTLSGITATSKALSQESAQSARRRFTIFHLALLLVPVILLSFFAGHHFGHKSKEPAPSYQRLTFRRGLVLTARFAPDGQTILYGAAWEGNPFQLFSARRESPESRSLGLPDADLLSISGSGEMLISLGRQYGIGFVTTGTLARVPLAGGAPREILLNVHDADWHPSTGEIAFAREIQRRFHLEFPAGKSIYETLGWISDIRFSPDGKYLAFFDHPDYGDDGGFVAIIDKAGNKKILTQRWRSCTGLAWSAAKNEIWFTSAESGTAADLYAVTLSGSTRLVSRMAGAMKLHDISREGAALISHSDGRRGILGLTHGETRERDLSWFDWSFPSGLSDDGKLLLLEEHGQGAGKSYSVYLRPTDGAAAVRLGEGRTGGFSPDGKSALMVSHPDYSRLSLLPIGAGEAKPIPSHQITYYNWTGWMPGREEIVFLGRTKEKTSRLYRQTLDGTKPVMLIDELLGFPWAISPDRKKIAANNGEGTLTIYPLAPPEARIVTGLVGYFPLRWTPDGNSLYLVRLGELPSKIYKYEIEKKELEIWKEIKPSDPAGIHIVAPVLLTPDGKSYVYGYRRTLSTLYLVQGLR